MGSLLTIPCPDYGLIYQIEAILLLIVSNIAMFIGFMPLFNYCSWRWFNCWPNHHQWLQNKVDAVIERVFDQVLKKNDQDEYFVLDYKAPTNYTNLLFLVLFSSLSAQWCNSGTSSCMRSHLIASHRFTLAVTDKSKTQLNTWTALTQAIWRTTTSHPLSVIGLCSE